MKKEIPRYPLILCRIFNKIYCFFFFFHSFDQYNVYCDTHAVVRENGICRTFVIPNYVPLETNGLKMFGFRNMAVYWVYGQTDI